MKRARRVALITALVVLAGLVAAFVLRSSTESPDSYDNMRKYVDGSLQSMSEEKPFTYKIVNITWLSAPQESPAGWCVVIDPPLRMRLQPGIRSILSHFFFTYQDPRWTGIRFEDTDIDRKRWAAIGCGEW